jgi:hypothetical protein
MNDDTVGLSRQVVDSLLADTNPYLSCDECFTLIDAYAERRSEDPGYDDPVVRAHMIGCGACAEEVETLLELLAADARSQMSR